MKSNSLLKNLIDLLFYLMIPGILGFLIIFPFGILTTSVSNVATQSIEDVEDLSIFYWLAVGFAFISYIILLIALFYLKKASKHFLDNNLLKLMVIKNLSFSGRSLLIVALTTFISYIFIWLVNFDNGNVSLTYGNNIFIPLFLAIIGLFFQIISNTLDNARKVKEENDLSI